MGAEYAGEGMADSGSQSEQSCCPDPFDRIGEKVMEPKEPFLWGIFGCRTITEGRLTYNVGSDGKITGIVPLAGIVPIGRAGATSLITLLGTTRTSFMNAVKNPKLLNIIKDLYRGGA